MIAGNLMFVKIYVMVETKKNLCSLDYAIKKIFIIVYIIIKLLIIVLICLVRTILMLDIFTVTPIYNHDTLWGETHLFTLMLHSQHCSVYRNTFSVYSYTLTLIHS